HTTNWELHRGQHLSTLRRVVRSDSFLPDGAEVLHSERRFGVYDGTPARWRGFEVTGRIDRIDRRSGRLVLVDYKTSSSAPLGAKNDVGDAKIDLQLPIYLEAAVPALGLVAEAAASTSTSAGSDDDGATMPAGNVDPTPAAPETVGAEYYSLTKARVIATTSRTGADAYDPDALQGVAQRAAAALDA